MHGLAFAAGYLNGATLSLYDAKGKKLESRAAVKTNDGVFVLRDVTLPTDFQVVATGGTMKGQAFTGSLKLDVSGYHRDQFLWLNEATTLAADYRDAHPTHTVAEANARVRNFLGLPSSVEIGWGLVGQSPQFDHHKFAVEALGDGGIDAFEAKLVREMDGGAQSDPVRFPAVAKNDAEEDIATIVLSTVAKGVLSAGTSFAFNEVMKEAGVTEDLGTQLQTLSATIQSFDTAMSNELAKSEYTAVHNGFTTESFLQIAMQRLAEEHTTTDATVQAQDAHDVECYALALAAITTVPANLKSDPCGEFSVTGDYKTVLNVINGTDSDVPLPEAWGAAYKANHSSLFYSSADATAAAAQYTTWRNLVAAEAAVLSEGLGADRANRADALPGIMDEINSVTCDGGKTVSCSGTTPAVSVGTLTKYEPPPLPGGVWVQMANDTMWTLGTDDADNPLFDTHPDFETFASEANGSLAANPIPSIDATTGQDINVTITGWGLPSKAQVNALMGDHAGSTTPGQWLDAQTGQVAHALLGQWDGDELWTSDGSCKGVVAGPGSKCPAISIGFLTYQLDTGLFTTEVTNDDQNGLIVRTMQPGELWTPLHW